ncbi:MAG: TetR/AcrR family transcriptional regulator [Acidimicrobiia bacterium]|nr:TetR/AcrR family transcriptional regulator [Acidimicrobiia bacterium]MYG72795.1 TetR/AcrR family transcriptional regulator [Acidimicrobiia bacterium]
MGKLGLMGESSKLRKYRSDHEDLNTHSRSAIIEAGQVLFLEQGIASTTMGEIAEQAGVSRVTVYRHFPECGAIAFEVYNRMLESILEATRAEVPAGVSGLDAARHCLTALFGAYPKQEAAFRFCAAFSTYYATEERSDELAEWYAAREFRGLSDACAQFFGAHLDPETSNRLMAITDAAASGLCSLAVSTPSLSKGEAQARLSNLKDFLVGILDA